MSNAAKMVIDDLEKFHLLTIDMKKQMIKGAYNTVATMAGKARKEAVAKADQNFTMRNNFSKKNILYEVSDFKPYISLEEIEAKVGATERAPWMERLELGGTQKPTHGETLAIPTDAARGGNPTKLVKKEFRVGDILDESRRVKGPMSSPFGNPKKTWKSKKARHIARVIVAHKEKKFIPLGGSGDHRNLHAVVSFKATGAGVTRKVEYETEQIYKFDLPETITRGKPWLIPAAEEAARDAQKIYISQMKKLGM
jgi:hypothetical protein